ncbi:MAG: hypothetical protein F6K17_21585 [Okeania sp. SIO3C4]|nr:hypothetical protein [Okeania sp. SIO3C4]
MEINLLPNLEFLPKDFSKNQNFSIFNIVGEISFIDGSILYWREFVNVKTIIYRGMYAYQYMTASKNLIFRYDNTRHHKKLNLPNFPHHKHDGNLVVTIFTLELAIKVIQTYIPSIIEDLESLIILGKLEVGE